MRTGHVARVVILSGRLRCEQCRIGFHSTWSTASERLICHECGGHCWPEGLQVVGGGFEDGEMFRLEVLAVRRTQS
jgi:hypothetical protein